MKDPKLTIERLRGETDRMSMSLYLSKSVYEKFKQSCEEIPPSKVIEELMREFVELYEKDVGEDKKKGLIANCD